MTPVYYPTKYLIVSIQTAVLQNTACIGIGSPDTVPVTGGLHFYEMQNKNSSLLFSTLCLPLFFSFLGGISLNDPPPSRCLTWAEGLSQTLTWLKLNTHPFSVISLMCRSLENLVSQYRDWLVVDP